MPGGEAEPGGWAHWLTGPAGVRRIVYGGAGGTASWRVETDGTRSLAYTFANQFFSNMVFEKPDWDVLGFDLDRDSRTADEKLGGLLNATNPDLRAFEARGGKLILYHGWNDAGVPPLGSVEYYQRVVTKVGDTKADGFLRLFMVPGMQHCSGGAGATSFGQVRIPGPAPGLSGDAEHDVLTALERWVEEGASPHKLVAVKRTDEAIPSSVVLRSRLLCAYPLVARYKRAGSTDDARSYVCGAAGER